MHDGDTWQAVAAAVGCNRESVRRWRKLPDAPQTPDVEAWRVFVEQRQLNKGNSDAEIRELRRQKLIEEVRNKRLTNAQLEGKMVPLEIVVEFHKWWAEHLHSGLEAMLINEMPMRALGKDAASLRVLGRAIADEYRDRIEEMAAEWRRTHGQPRD